MEYRYSEKARKEISVLGFGGWQLGNEAFFGKMSKTEGVELVREAVNRGINFFDTAPGYSGGLSETMIGEGIKGHRKNVFINTKFGHHADGSSDFSVEKIESSIRSSMNRMNTTYIDSVILHNPEFYILEGKTDHFKEFKRLKKAGLIHNYGVSIDTKEELRAVLDHLDVGVIEIMFNIIHQDVREYFDEVKEKGILLIIKVPLDSGWLTGKYTQDTTFTGIRSRWTPEVIETRVKIVQKIKDIVNEEVLVNPALGFVVAHEAVTTVIPGVRNKAQLISNKQAVKYKLSEETLEKLYTLHNTYIKNQHTPW